MWSDFESDVVEGQYRLGKLVRSEGRCAWYETRLPEEKPALISLTESLNDETSLLERLRAAAKVRHSNVTAILHAGTTKLRDTPLVYAVMEHTEENLEDVLRTRALSAEEAKQVAEGLTNALEAIHKERLTCGRLETASVLASGDTIKLRCDNLQIVPRDATLATAEAKDVQGLGAVLYQCLTQSRPKLDGNDPSIQLLAQPFVQIVRKALSGQATVAEIATLLRPAIPVSNPPASSGAGSPAAKPAPEVAVKPVSEVPRLEAKAEPAESEPGSPRRWWILGAIALLVILGITVRMFRHSPDPKPASSSAQVPQQSAPDAAPSAAPAPAVQHKPTAARSAAPLAAPAMHAANAVEAWRVVAFTYNRQDQAEHKVQTIVTRHPEFQAGVFSPKGQGAPYLVTLGGPMDRDAAVQLRDKAIHAGLPRDTYVQNYSH